MAERLRISSDSPFEPTIGFSRAVRVGDRVVVSGTGPVVPGGRCPDAAGAQARRCFEIIEAALAEAGASLDDVVRTRMYLTSAGDGDAVGAVHGELLGHVRPGGDDGRRGGIAGPRLEGGDRSRGGAALRGEPRDGGGDDVGAAQVADEARLHAVHDVADGELRVLVA